MPHVIIEYAPDLGQCHDLQDLCDQVFDALANHPAIPEPKSLKIRVLPVSNMRTGTLVQGFAHATLLVLPRRDLVTKRDLSQTVLDVLQNVLPDIASLSVDVSDLGPAYTKRVL